MNTNIKNGALLGAMVLIAYSLKKFYQHAEVTDLQWILTPTKTLVQSFTGLHFSYDPTQGHINTVHQFVIAKSCAGINFLIIVFCTSVCGFSLKLTDTQKKWWSVPVFLVFAYLLTLLVNTFRIVNALMLGKASLPHLGMDANRLHETIGVVIYLSFLLIYYLTINYLLHKKTNFFTPYIALSQTKTIETL